MAQESVLSARMLGIMQVAQGKNLTRLKGLMEEFREDLPDRWTILREFAAYVNRRPTMSADDFLFPSFPRFRETNQAVAEWLEKRSEYFVLPDTFLRSLVVDACDELRFGPLPPIPDELVYDTVRGLPPLTSILARYQPRDEDNLKPWAKNWIGVEGEWLTTTDDTHNACGLVYGRFRTIGDAAFGWAPIEDFIDIKIQSALPTVAGRILAITPPGKDIRYFNATYTIDLCDALSVLVVASMTATPTRFTDLFKLVEYKQWDELNDWLIARGLPKLSIDSPGPLALYHVQQSAAAFIAFNPPVSASIAPTDPTDPTDPTASE